MVGEREAPLDLEASISSLRGVGPARAALFAKLGVRSLRDLLLLPPKRLKQWGGRKTVEEIAAAVGCEVRVRGVLGAPSLYRPGRRRTVVRTLLDDGTGQLPCFFFNQPWMFDRLKELRAEGQAVELLGRVVAGRGGLSLAASKVAGPSDPLPVPGSLTCIYPRVAGIGETLVAKLLAEVLELADLLPERLSREQLTELGVPPLPQAVRELHAPGDIPGFQRARDRCLLEPLLGLQARLARSRGQGRGRARAVAFPPRAWEGLLERMPFEPTEGQRQVLAELASDLHRTRPMRRLLQGDVGCGKTLVGLCAAYAVVQAGGQAAFMAPTELLAEQHYLGFRSLLEDLAVPSVLLTSGRSGPERKRALGDLRKGRAGIAFGTHSLFSRDVRFQRLDLAVIDEQQRFGVAHKRALLDKGHDVHVLLMTATPIPRTLALTLYGDLEVSRLGEGPPQRAGVRTFVRREEDREKIVAFLAERMAAGEQVFWVCPRISEGDKDGEEEVVLPHAQGVHREFRRDGRLKDHGVELGHGAQEHEERAKALERFRRGRSKLCVSTTIIEVGVDVPAATVLVVEGAERFGLAQLHQLRGRVGRGSRPGWCILIDGGTDTDRLELLAEEGDGFAIAEEDLRRRGMGELDGLRQAGSSGEPTEDPERELELLLAAHRLVRTDPGLVRVYGQRSEREPDLV